MFNPLLKAGAKLMEMRANGKNRSGQLVFAPWAEQAAWSSFGKFV
jgi:hypothetical protein